MMMLHRLLRKHGETLMLTNLRIVVGLITVMHGWQKLVNLEAWQHELAELGVAQGIGIASYLVVGAQWVGGACLALGLLTRGAALITASMLATTLGAVYLPTGPFVSNAGFELTLIMFAATTFFVFRGAGPWSVDTWIVARRRMRTSTTNVPGASNPTPDPVTEAGLESFPASDPPSFTPEKTT